MTLKIKCDSKGDEGKNTKINVNDLIGQGISWSDANYLRKGDHIILFGIRGNRRRPLRRGFDLVYIVNRDRSGSKTAICRAWNPGTKWPSRDRRHPRKPRELIMEVDHVSLDYDDQGH